MTEWVQAGAAIAQSLAALVSLFVTIWLARVAKQTLEANERMAASAERNLAHLNDQLDLEYEPNVVMSNLTWPEGRLEIFNLGRSPILIYQIGMQIANEAPVELVALAAPPGDKAIYQAPENLYIGFKGRRLEGKGYLSLEFYHGTTKRKRYRLEGVQFETNARINSDEPRLIVFSQGSIKQLPDRPDPIR